MLIAARAMRQGMQILRPLLTEKGVETIGTVILGTAKGDLHDIGKNLVGMMLEGAGVERIDLGTDIAPEKFIQTAKEKKAYLIGVSALLTTTMVSMKDVAKALFIWTSTVNFFPFATSAEIKEHIQEAVKRLGSEKRGVNA